MRDGDTLRATIACGGGTYIRALARDLGRLTGSAAHLAALRRVRSGPFHVADAVPLDALRAGEVVAAPGARRAADDSARRARRRTTPSACSRA